MEEEEYKAGGRKLLGKESVARPPVSLPGPSPGTAARGALRCRALASSSETHGRAVDRVAAAADGVEFAGGLVSAERGGILDAPDGEFEAGTDAEAAAQVARVARHGGRADPEFGSDLLVAAAFADHSQNLSLAVRKNHELDGILAAHRLGFDNSHRRYRLRA